MGPQDPGPIDCAGFGKTGNRGKKGGKRGKGRNQGGVFPSLLGRAKGGGGGRGKAPGARGGGKRVGPQKPPSWGPRPPGPPGGGPGAPGGKGREGREGAAPKKKGGEKEPF